MNESEHSTARDSDLDDAPDLTGDGWPEKFAKAKVRRGWQTRIDEALRDWIGKQGTA